MDNIEKLNQCIFTLGNLRIPAILMQDVTAPILSVIKTLGEVQQSLKASAAQPQEEEHAV